MDLPQGPHICLEFKYKATAKAEAKARKKHVCFFDYSRSFRKSDLT